jgi:transposase
MTMNAGIDVGAASVVLVCRQSGRGSVPEPFEQSIAGHAALVRRLRKLAPQRVVLEATGIYYLDLALALRAADLPVAVINPRSFHHFAKLKLVGSKTDGVDAALLAEYAERMNPPLWQAPDPHRLALRDVGRQINRLTAARTQAKNRLHALRAKASTLPLLIDDEIEGIALLNRRIQRLTAAAVELLGQAPELARQCELIDAATGIAQASAIAILAELCVLPSHLKANQVSRYAGLDVRLWQSGTSVNQRARMSKAGNAYLRSALFMPAMSAVRHDPRAKAFSLTLQRNGKKKMQAVGAVMRKYLTGIWACLKTDRPFDSAKLFSEIHLMET